jgi:DegV family protein with EDD domain
MAKVKVITDSVAGISPEIARQHNITILPAVYIVFDGKPYLDGVDINAEEAYRMLQKDPDKFSPSTLPPAYLAERYREISQESKEMVFVTFSSTFSAAGKLAALAAETLQQESPDIKIRVVDSLSAGATQALLVITAAGAAAKGMTIDQVVSIIEQAKPKTRGLMMLATLKYVYRTGRMSKTAAAIASLLNIKPINRLNTDGTIELIDRVRNLDKGYEKMIELIREEAGIDSLHFIVQHAAAPEMAEKFCGLLKDNFNCLSLLVSEYSPIMGYASGPGCIFCGFQPELSLF